MFRDEVQALQRWGNHVVAVRLFSTRISITDSRNRRLASAESEISTELISRNELLKYLWHISGNSCRKPTIFYYNSLYSMAHYRRCYIFATVIKNNRLWDASSLLIILSDWLFSSESMRLGGLGPFISSAFWCGSWLESQLEVVEVEVTTRHQTGQRRSSHDNRLVIKFGTRCWGTMTCDDGGFWPLAFSFWQLIEKLKGLILSSSCQWPIAILVKKSCVPCQKTCSLRIIYFSNITEPAWMGWS